MWRMMFMYEACALYWERTGGYVSMSSVMHEPFAGYNSIHALTLSGVILTL